MSFWIPWTLIVIPLLSWCVRDVREDVRSFRSMGYSPKTTHKPQTRYEHLRAEFVRGNVSLEIFEEGVALLLESDSMDETHPIRIGPPPPPMPPTPDRLRKVKF